MRNYWSLIGFIGGYWALVGFLGNAIWFTRFAVQWIASERRRQVIIPVAFWWISIVGSIVMSIYFMGQEGGPDWPGVVGFVPNSVIYARNLILHKKNAVAATAAAVAAAKSAAGDAQIVQSGKPGPTE
jgi:lipid-A-disaccharide synthase-like uncharacterized protein